MKDLSSTDLIALCSVIVALSALGVAIWQAWLMRQHQILSVKPHLEVSLSACVEGKNAFLIYFLNAGVGPAFIKSVHVKYMETSLLIQTESDMKKLICLLAGASTLKYEFHIVEANSAISSDKQLNFLAINADNQAPALMQLRAAFKECEIEVNYTCLYGREYSSTFVGSKIMS